MDAPMSQVFRVTCACGWASFTSHARVMPHHKCPSCDGPLTHRAPTPEETKALERQWKGAA
jgi:hypothetical protein